MAFVGKNKEKVDVRNNWRSYWNFVKNYRIYFVFLIVIVLIVEATRVADKFLFKVIIDDGTSFASGEIVNSAFVNTLLIVVVVFFGLLVIRAVGDWFLISMMNKLEGSIVFDLKKKFFDHIVHLSHRFHTTHKTGSLISKLTRGSRAIERLTDFLIFNMAPLLLQLIIVGITLAFFDWLSAIVIIVTALIFISYGLLMTNMQQSANLKANDAEDREKANVSDVLTNIDSIKYYGKEDVIKRRFSKLADDTRLKFIRFWSYGKYFDVGQTLILGIGTFFLIYFPILKFLEGEITIGTIAFIYTAYLSLMGPLFGFVHSVRGFYQSMADLQALFAYEKIKNEIEDKPGASKLKVRKGEIEFKDLDFSYHQRKIIEDLNLKIKPNERVALVGRSGSGKTTLLKLLYRLYDANKGEILIDGKNIKNFKQESLRTELSIVPQEAILFDDTIYNNIAFSRAGASRDDVMNAMKAAQLDSFIAGLPEGEKTIVGERGVKLSGGEKQRVSIARAILANKKILVLDEATSSLDSETEHEIQKDLEKLMEGRTSIIIAHRLSTIMKADKIVVMENGKIAQIGKHWKLIRQPGPYRRLWNLQKGGYLKE